jgi:hypothetical protein
MEDIIELTPKESLTYYEDNNYRDKLKGKKLILRLHQNK